MGLTIDEKLDLIIKQTAPPDPGATAKTKLWSGEPPEMVKPPAEKVYKLALEQAHGKTPEERLAYLVKQVRQRKPGYPESSQGIVGQWDTYPWVQPFIDDYPNEFKK